MEFPDVLALEAGEAVRILQEAGYSCEVIATERPHGKNKAAEEGTVTEYVVRQRKLDNNKAEIITVRRFRKGGVHDGTQN